MVVSMDDMKVDSTVEKSVEQKVQKKAAIMVD